MSEEIKVSVIRYPDRDNLVLRYVDPVTGKHKTKSAGTKSEKDAQKGRRQVAERRELREGRYKPASKITWDEPHASCYESEVLDSLRRCHGQQGRNDGVFNAVEEHVCSRRLADLTAAHDQRAVLAAAKKGLAETTIKGHMAHLVAALGWGSPYGDGIHKVPEIDMPRRAKGSEGNEGTADHG